MRYFQIATFICLTIEGIEKVEIKLRTEFTYRTAILLGNPLYYTSDKWFRISEERYQTTYEELSKEEKRQTKQPYIKHHREKYSNTHLPLWIAASLMTLGMCVNFVNLLLSRKLQNEIVNASGFRDFQSFHGFLVSLTELRNVCAHHGRLWNRVFMKRTPVVKKFNVQGDLFPLQSSTKCYMHLLLMACILHHMYENESWGNRLGYLLKTILDWQLEWMGAPVDFG